MKEVKIIITLIYLVLLQGCATTANKEFIADQEEPTIIAESVLIEQLKVNELSNVQLNAFEQKGLQLLKDLEDYLNLMKDEQLERQFKLQARNQLTDLFLDKTLINSNLDFINESITSRYVFNETRIIRGLEQTGDHYTGSLEFQLLEYDQDQVKTHSTIKTLDFFAIRKPKSFGENEELVWEVLLGPLNFSSME